jgi:hypothetical protein
MLTVVLVATIPPPPVALNCGPHSSKEGYRASAEIWPDFRFMFAET